MGSNWNIAGIDPFYRFPCSSNLTKLKPVLGGIYDHHKNCPKIIKITILFERSYEHRFPNYIGFQDYSMKHLTLPHLCTAKTNQLQTNPEAGLVYVSVSAHTAYYELPAQDIEKTDTRHILNSN